MKNQWIPETPGGTLCDWLASDTENEAWQKLMREATHMPYKTIEDFKARGYTVEEYEVYDE